MSTCHGKAPLDRVATRTAGAGPGRGARAGQRPRRPRAISWAEIVGHAVRIDRTGPLGNPFRLRDPNDERERAEVIARCAAEHFPKAADLARDPCPPGSVLICWCYDKKSTDPSPKGRGLELKDSEHVEQAQGL